MSFMQNPIQLSIQQLRSILEQLGLTDVSFPAEPVVFLQLESYQLQIPTLPTVESIVSRSVPMGLPSVSLQQYVKIERIR